jgi:hypothetical protein
MTDADTSDSYAAPWEQNQLFSIPPALKDINDPALAETTYGSSKRSPAEVTDAYLEAPLNLREQEIRLVKLEHSHASEPIKCTLRSVPIDGEHPAYVAVSYSWGPKERYDDIELNGASFPVGRNLWMFLHQMRSQHQYITFWIDALSIDQANVFERNQQVRLMRQIYSNAHSVWVWLGEADTASNSDIAMQYIRAREPLGEKDINYKRFWSPTKARAVLALCERDYWKRIWIVQEILLAKKVTFLCGQQQVSGNKMQGLMTDLQLIADRGRAMHTHGAVNVLDSSATTIINAKIQWDGSPQPLTTLLKRYRNQQSTDVRDKVYALHGLASNSHAIPIDYNITPEELLVDVIYHTCSPEASTSDMKMSKKDLLHFAKSLREALKATCTEEELSFHVSRARGGGISTEDYMSGVRGTETTSNRSNGDTVLAEVQRPFWESSRDVALPQTDSRLSSNGALWLRGQPGGEVAEVKEQGEITIESHRGNTIKKNASPDDPAVHIARSGNDIARDDVKTPTR